MNVTNRDNYGPADGGIRNNLAAVEFSGEGFLSCRPLGFWSSSESARPLAVLGLPCALDMPGSCHALAHRSIRVTKVFALPGGGISFSRWQQLARLPYLQRRSNNSNRRLVAQSAVVLGFAAFIVYSTWAGYSNANYEFGPYLSRCIRRCSSGHRRIRGSAARRSPRGGHPFCTSRRPR